MLSTVLSNSIETYKKLESKVLKYIRENKLIKDNDTVVVATSGGADSMALLFVIHNLVQQGELGNNITLAATTVNHGIRGETADRDMEYVERFCESIGVRCVTFNAKTDGTVVPDGASEEWARQLRYKYFSKLPKLLNTKVENLKIATAHTKSDQAETILFRLSRNSSYKSLMGIPVKRGCFIRPFLCLTRKETEAICVSQGIEYMTDETNLTDDYCRNKIRHSVLPVMMQINSSAMDHLAELANFNNKLNSYFLDKAKALDKAANVAKFKWDVDTILQYPDLEIDAFINYLIEMTGNQPSKVNMELVKRLLKSGKGSVEISKDLTIKIESYTQGEQVKRNITFVTSENDVAVEMFSTYLADYLDAYGIYTMNRCSKLYSVIILKMSIKSAKQYVETNGIRTLSSFATYEKLFESNLMLAGVNPNDSFTPACRSARKIKKLYKEMQIVPDNISKVPCIKDSNGNVVWVYNVGFTDGYSPFDKDFNFTEALQKSNRPDSVYLVKAI